MAAFAEAVVGNGAGDGLGHGCRLGIGETPGVVAGVNEGQVVRIETDRVIEVVDDAHGNCAPVQECRDGRLSSAQPSPRGRT
ncbi:hypothetical protein D3C81_1999360 [compost metagenome]